MTKRQFVVLAFRLFSVYLLFSILSQLGYFINGLTLVILNGGSLGTMYLAAAVSICFSLAVITFLWRKTEWLMERIFAIPSLANLESPKNPDQVEHSVNNLVGLEKPDYYETPVSSESLQIVAFSLLGAWAVIYNLPTLLSILSMFFISRNKSGRDPFMDDFQRDIPRLISHAVVIALGIYLFLRPWQFQEWIWKFWPKEPEEVENSSESGVH
jgi:hypothetical protein